MSDSAKVDSVDALKSFRVSLCKFADAVRVALSEADADLRRASVWLRQEQGPYWKAQIHKRQELVNRAKVALLHKQFQEQHYGGRSSCIDEKKALAKAKRDLEEAEQKLENVRRWGRQLEQEVFTYKGVVQGLNQTVDVDIPRTLTQLDNMSAALEAYAGVEPGPKSSVAMKPAGDEQSQGPQNRDIQDVAPEGEQQ